MPEEQKPVDQPDYPLFVDDRINSAPIDKSSGYTLLHRAAYLGLDKIIKLLILKPGFAVDSNASKLSTPLYAALQPEILESGHEECVRILLRGGAIVKQKKIKIPYLAKAAARNSPTVFQMLLNKCAQADLALHEGLSALHVVAYYGNEYMLSLLFAKKCSVNLPGINQITPLHLATLQGNLNAVQMLLQEQADPNAKVQDQFTPLHLALVSEDTDIFYQLFQAGAKLNLEEDNGLSLLRLAARKGLLPIVQLLLKEGANPNPETPENYIPITELDEKTIRSISSSEEIPPLFYAAWNGDHEIARELLQAGADANCPTNVRYIPLFAAVLQSDVEMVRLLLAFQADPNRQTTASKSSLLRTALLNEDHEIAELLRGAGSTATDIASETLTPDRNRFDRQLIAIQKNILREEEKIKAPFKEALQIIGQYKLDEQEKSLEGKPIVSGTPTENLRGRFLKLRIILERVLIEQPNRQIHNKEICWLIRQLGGFINNKDHQHRVFFNETYFDYYEVLHDKDPRGYLTQGWVRRVAKIIQSACQNGLIQPEMLQYFPKDSLDTIDERF